MILAGLVYRELNILTFNVRIVNPEGRGLYRYYFKFLLLLYSGLYPQIHFGYLFECQIYFDNLVILILDKSHHYYISLAFVKNCCFTN